MSMSWERTGYKVAIDSPGTRPGTKPGPPPGTKSAGSVTQMFARSAVGRSMAKAPSAWVGLVLMVANTGIALVDLSLLAGNLPH
jgi:hypothetical protein